MRIILRAIGILFVIAALGLVGGWDYQHQLEAQAAYEARNAQMRLRCLPRQLGDLALIDWQDNGELVCVVYPKEGRAQGAVFKGGTWKPL